MADPIRELSDLLARLPGVGRRTALRLAFHLLGAPEEYARELGQAIARIRDRVRPCSVCRNLTEQDPCAVCGNPRRDRSIICVVAGVPDLWAIEETGSYRGLYHVLHGLLAPLDGVGPEDLHLDALRARVQADGTAEVIVATRPSVEGEATAFVVRDILKDLPVRVSRIASGVPHGGELEYADRVTLGFALDGRRNMP
ncbi:MAG: recombination mediator RecR [Deltaproteobacteria bacterium]|nr:recombination mediator RecR [Deltaproteobacteria bacterium]